MGLGMVVVVSRDSAQQALTACADSRVVGELKKRTGDPVEIVSLR
jgi:phosphoribosylaminoimidazole (AIR) synthetase